MDMRILTIVLFAALGVSACSEHRQTGEPAGAVRPSVARYVGDDWSRKVPDALVVTATDALTLLFSDRAASYTNWPGAIKGRPPQAPFTEFVVERLDVIGDPGTVQVFLAESGPDRRGFSVYWNAANNECESISITMP